MTEKNNQAQPSIDETSMEDAHLVDHIKASAKEIWLAGLGAFSQKQAESPNVFQQLVKEGKELERVSREHLDRQIQQVRSAAMESVGSVKDKATDSLSRLENVFDQRVSNAVKRIGLMSQADARRLEARIEGLEAQLRDLEGQLNSPS